MAQIRIRDLVPVDEIELSNMFPLDSETLTKKLTVEQFLAFILDAIPPSGGGGGSLDWVQGANAPIEDQENGRKVSKFTPTEDQEVTTTFTVPDTYQAGMPIRLHLPFYSPDVTGNVRFETVTTLIKNGEAVTGTTNQHTSTNAVTNLATGPLANKRIMQTLDLTTEPVDGEGGGEINSVEVGAYDELQISLKLKSADTTAASDVKAQLKGAFITVIEIEE